MGNHYQHVTVKGPAVEDVAKLMRELGRPAYIASAADDVIVIFDAGLDAMDRLSDVADVPATLSSRLGCPALVAGVYDDDLLYLSLYEGRENTFEYDSRARRTGNIGRLCSAFGRPSAVLRVWAILTLPHFIPYLFESFRHRHLLQALRLPEWAAFTGYRTIEHNAGRPHGVAPEALIKV
jgi:hypothetical protein